LHKLKSKVEADKFYEFGCKYYSSYTQLVTQLILTKRIEVDCGISSIGFDDSKEGMQNRNNMAKSLEEGNLLSIGKLELITDLEQIIEESLQAYLEMWSILIENYVNVNKLYHSLLKT
jgi:hypothetical protein